MSRLRYPLLLGLFASILYAHADALAGMKRNWDNSPMYSFGYFVPLVSVFLLWTQRHRLAAVAPRSSLAIGLPTLGVGLLLLVGGHLGGVQIAQQVAFVVSLFAAVLLVFGPGVLRVVWVALAYLLLMVPIWDAFTEPLHLPFQKLSATVGIQMLHLGGIPAHREGTLLYLPNITLEVARACSGVNYLVAVLALGVPLAYLYLHTLGRRLVLLGSAIVIAAFSNSLRVALIGALAYFEVGSPLHGPFHVLHGLFVSGIGYLVLFMGVRVLAPVPRGLDPASSAPPRPSWPAFRAEHALATSFVFLAAGIYLARYEPRPEVLRMSLGTIPTSLGDWAAEPVGPGRVAWWEGAENVLARRYGRVGAQSADVWILHFAAQRQGKELVNSRGDALYRSATTAWLPSSSGDQREVNLTRLAVDGRRRVGLFWYEIDGRVVASKYTAKWLTIWGAVARGSNGGAVVLVMADEAPEASAARQLAELGDLGARLHAALAGVLPGRQP